MHTKCLKNEWYKIDQDLYLTQSPLDKFHPSCISHALRLMDVCL